MKGTFFIDFFATIPIDVIAEVIMGYEITSLTFFGLLKLGRLLRINKIIQFLKASRDFKAGAKLINLIFFLIIYLHCYACGIWLSVKHDKMWVPYFLQDDKILETIHKLYYKEDISFISNYLIVLYVSV